MSNLSKAEIRKDQVQDSIEAATHAAGQVSNIVITAVGDVVKAIGGFATDLFEIREAARRPAARGRRGGRRAFIVTRLLGAVLVGEEERNEALASRSDSNGSARLHRVRRGAGAGRPLSGRRTTMSEQPAGPA